jgi:predicted N-formylglutamate amidohydrolase
MLTLNPTETGPIAQRASFEVLSGEVDGGFLILVDHATNYIPPEYLSLGLPAEELERHIAFDVGAGPLARSLSERFRAPAVLTRFSRLLIDANRGEDDPTLIMRISDRTIVPGNIEVDPAERERRLTRFHRPYHREVERMIDEMIGTGNSPAILSIHSYTPIWRGAKRPWHAGVLWDQDPRLASPLLAELSAEHGLRVGDNEPYVGWLKNDTMYRHATRRGLAHVLLEIRNDLIETPAGVLEWADRLELILHPIVAARQSHEIRYYGSRADGEEGEEGEQHVQLRRRHAHGA